MGAGLEEDDVERSLVHNCFQIGEGDARCWDGLKIGNQVGGTQGTD